MIENVLDQDQKNRQRAKRMGVAPSVSLRRHFLALARQVRQWHKSSVRAGVPCTIGVTSLSPGAGNSTIAYNLSVAMTTLSRSRVLLVESNFGHHFISRRLGQSRKPGICELLSGMAEMEEAVNETPIKNLELLGCGQVPEQAALELPFDEMPAVISHNFSEYGYTIFDLPPANHLTACFSVAPHLDGIILSVEANNIDQKQIARFRQAMNNLGVEIIGMVINKQ